MISSKFQRKSIKKIKVMIKAVKRKKKKSKIFLRKRKKILLKKGSHKAMR